MVIASLAISLRLFAASSLKEKRMVAQSVKERLRNRFNVAVAEVGAQDQWRTLELGVVTVGSDRVVVEREIEALTRFLDGDVRFEMIERDVVYH